MVVTTDASLKCPHCGKSHEFFDMVDRDLLENAMATGFDFDESSPCPSCGGGVHTQIDCEISVQLHKAGE